MAEIESANSVCCRVWSNFQRGEAEAIIEVDRNAVRLAAKLEALCEMHHTAMRLRKYGREPEWLGAAFTELRARYEGPTSGEEKSDG